MTCWESPSSIFPKSSPTTSRLCSYCTLSHSPLRCFRPFSASYHTSLPCRFSVSPHVSPPSPLHSRSSPWCSTSSSSTLPKHVSTTCLALRPVSVFAFGSHWPHGSCPVSQGVHTGSADAASVNGGSRLLGILKASIAMLAVGTEQMICADPG